MVPVVICMALLTLMSLVSLAGIFLVMRKDLNTAHDKIVDLWVENQSLRDAAKGHLSVTQMLLAEGES